MQIKMLFIKKCFKINKILLNFDIFFAKIEKN